MAESVNHTPESDQPENHLVRQALASPGGRERIFGMIIGSVRDYGTAEELCQNVCHNLLQRQHHYDPNKGSVWAWISGFVRNEIVNHFSQQKRRREQHDNAMDELPSRLSIPPLAEIEQAELLELLKANLNKLSERSRAVLWHHYINGDSDIESARQLGLTPENVRQIRRRALLELRQYIGVLAEVTS